MTYLLRVIFIIQLGYAPTVFFLGPPSWNNPITHIRPIPTWTWRFR